MSGKWWIENGNLAFGSKTEADAYAASNPSLVYNGLMATIGGSAVVWRDGAWVGSCPPSPMSSTSGNVLTTDVLSRSTHGYYINESGVLVPIAGGYAVTEQIPVPVGTKWCYRLPNAESPSVNVSGCFFDGTGTVISGKYPGKNLRTVVPPNAVSLRTNYSTLGEQPTLFFQGGNTKATPESLLYDFAGDSITYGIGSSSAEKTFPRIFAAECGIPASSVFNNGVGDSTLTNLAGHSPYSVRIKTGIVRKDCAMLVITYGTNDFRYGVAIGNPGDTADTTFYGAIHTVMTYMRDYRKLTRVVFCKPLLTTDTISAVAPMSSFWGAIDYTKTIFPEVTIIDFNESGVETGGLSQMVYSGDVSASVLLHPNDDAYRLMGMHLARSLK